MTKKPKVVRLSAHAKLCVQLNTLSGPYDRALDRVLAQLKRLQVPAIPRLGPAPSAESVVAELKARATAQRRAREKRRAYGVDSFLLYAWTHASTEARARCMACGDHDTIDGDFEARAYARTVRDLLAPADYASFLDELCR